MVQRVCGTGIEVICQASDAVSLGRARLALCVGTEFDEPQPDRRLYASRRLSPRAGRVQGFPVGGAARPRRQCEHGRHRGESRPPVPDHPARGGRLCGAQLRAGDERAEVGLPGRRDRAGEERDLRARRLPDARPQAQRREGACRRHPCPPLPARGARQHPAGLRRRADRRQFVGDRRRRGGGAGRLVRLRQDIRQDAARAHPGGRRRRRAARDHGHRAGAGDQGGARARRPQALRHRPLRDQRGVRRAGHGLRARARPRRGQAQRQRRRDRDRAPARRHRRAARDHAGARAQALRRCATASPRPASAAARASRC